MATLIADRFLCDAGALDLATGEVVDLRIEHAGTRSDQEAWINKCAKAFGDRRARLVDFGFIGRDRRFEARRVAPRKAAPAAAPVSIEAALEWLEETSPASPKVLYRTLTADDVILLAREIRLRGFIPLRLSMLQDGGLGREVARVVAARSVVLVQQHVDEAQIALAFLTLLCANARNTWAIVGVRAEHERRRPLMAQAAEARAVYGRQASSRRSGLAADVPVGDVRAVRMLDEAQKLMARGRHAAAERALRASLAAFDRRDDLLHAGDSAALLGRLLMNRGRAGDAESAFEIAVERLRRLSPSAPALAAPAIVDACVRMGLAQTDLGLLPKADETLRAVYSAAAALRDGGAHLTAAVALARNMFWQGRYADAASVLESITPEGPSEPAVRYWCLTARVRLTVDDLPGAWGAVERASSGVGEAVDAGCEAVLRTAKAAVQARLGDLDALEFHLRAGLRAAATAHLPLQALRLRLTAIEALLDTGHHGRARESGRRLNAMAKMLLPAPLKTRLDRVVKRLAGTTAHETGPCFSPSVRSREAIAATNLGDMDGLTELLLVCNSCEDERDALKRAAAVIRKQAGALGIGILGSAGKDMATFGMAGSVNHSLGRRCIDLGMPIRPERTAAGVEAATPIRYLGRLVGSVISRWSVPGPPNVERAMAFGAAAAAACAPVVYVLLERNSSKAQEAPETCADLIGTSQAIEEVRRAITRAANAPFTVLVEGESGSGKELVARAIHLAGCRRQRRFCALNCAALPEDLVDAELFGHAKGAFTGAATERLGLFESADGGTVFLDEVGELSARAQAKLLRVLQEGEIRRIGENFTRPIDGRLIAATNRSLKAEVEAGRFRQDLLYRLDVIRIAVPPLRERVEDIPLLATRFWRQAAERIGSKAVLGQGAVSMLARYDWPGNVRELQNVLTGLLVAVPARGVVSASHMPAAISRAMRPVAGETLETARIRFEERFVRAALARAAGHRGQTATALGVSRQGLAKLMHRLQIP